MTSCPRCPVRPEAAEGGLLRWAWPCSSGRPDRALSRLTVRFRRPAAGRQEGPWTTLAGAGLAGDPGGSREAPVMPAGRWLPSWRRVMPARIRRLPGPASRPGYREDGRLCERSNVEMIADARTAGPGVFVVSTGRCGSTMLSNMLRLNPGILSLSEFFSLLMPDPFPAGDLDAAAYWRLLSEPWVFFRHLYRLGLRVPEFLYVPGPGSRFTAATGIPPILVTALPHLSEDPEGLYDDVEAFAAGLTPASAAAQHRRLIGWLCDRLGARAWVERSGSSLLYISQLADLFPRRQVRAPLPRRARVRVLIQPPSRLPARSDLGDAGLTPGHVALPGRRHSRRSRCRPICGRSCPGHSITKRSSGSRYRSLSPGSSGPT